MREHFYSSPWMDRAELRRVDDEWLRGQLGDARTRIVPVWHEHSLVQLDGGARAVEIAIDQLPAPPADEDMFFLGVDGDGRACFGLLLPDDEEPPEFAGVAGEFMGLRRVGGMLSPHDAGLLAYARAVAYWHKSHRFCGRCGFITAVERAGWLRVCRNGECGRQHFPRTDPAIIVRVEHEDRVLLGRQPQWPDNWYSVLAGFVEPGEGLEEAVRREVFEETGVAVDDVRYDSSQPWPFPASLMIGFSARAHSTELRLESDELEDARWFSREEIAAGVEAGTLRLSPRQSISRHLLDAWIQPGRTSWPGA